MRFMMMIKASRDSEAGVMPSPEAFEEMAKYNDELIKSGVLLDAAGLHASASGARVVLSRGKKTVLDGPFAETKELIAGFWMIQVKSREEAIEWAKRCPSPETGEAHIELRQVFDGGDFGPEVEERVRKQREANRCF